MSSNFNNAKIINVYYNKGDRKPYDVNGKPIAYIGEEFVGSNEGSELRFFFGQDLDSATPMIITKRPDGQTYLDLCEKVGTGANSYYKVVLNNWYAEVKGKLTLIFKVYNGTVTLNEGNTEILSASGQVIVSDIFNLEVGYAPLATSAVPPYDPSPEASWYFALSQKLDKAQSITVTGALPTLTGDVYDDRYFYVENEGVGRLYYINGSSAIEVVWQVGTLKLTATGNGELTADTGKIAWDEGYGGFEYIQYRDVANHIGQDIEYYGKAVGTIAKGDVIQFAGVQGNHFLIKKAVPSEINANPKYIMGISKQSLINNEFGYVAHFGRIRGIDTSGYSEGALLWFSSSSINNGELTTTTPVAPNAKVLMAVVVDDANNGTILVRPTIEPSIKELQDVNITSIANNQVLRWNNANLRWENTSALTTAESDIDALEGRMTTAEGDIDSLKGRMTSAENDIANIFDGTTIVPKALADQNGNVINTTYLTQSSASATYIPLSQKGQANGVVPLGSNGKVPSIYLSGEQDDIQEFDTLEDFPLVGEADILYVAIDTNKLYRWGGSAYVVISETLALGTTNTTAFPGDRGLALETLTDNIVDGDQALALKNQVIRNTVVGTSPLVVNSIASTTANLTEFQVNGTKVLEVTPAGGLTQNGTRLFSQPVNTDNTFFGFSSGNSTSTTGSSNTGLGAGSLFSVTSGFENTGVGVNSLRGTTTGFRNTGVGINASRNITTGNANTFVGQDAGFNASQLATASNSTAIGNGSFTDKSNQMVFGNASVTEFKFDRNASATLLVPQITSSFSGGNSTFNRGTTALTNESASALEIKHTTSADMVDGFGARQLFTIRDSANVDNTIARLGSIRSGADNSGRFVFETANAGTTTEKMTILPNGNVGIGTASPARLLSLVTSSNDDGIQIRRNSSDTNAYATLGFRIVGGGENAFNTSEIRGVLTNRTSFADTDLTFLTFTGSGSLTEKMRIRNDGNVGIGTTSPTVRLQVNHTEANVLAITRSGGTNANTVIEYRQATTSWYAGVNATNDFGFRYNVADLSASQVIIKNDGKVGIGTSAPATILSVITGSNTDGIQIRRNAGANDSIALLGFTATTVDSSSNMAEIRAVRTNRVISTDTDLRFLTQSNSSLSEKMRIRDDGLVGINETAPTAQLQVKSGATTRVPLIVDTIASQTADLAQYKINGTNISRIDSSGYFVGIGLYNITGANNALIITDTTGTSIRRNVADTNPALIVNLASAGATGNIQVWQKAGSALSQISNAGIFVGQSRPTRTDITANATLALADEGKVLRVNPTTAADNITITIPKNSVVAFPIDTEIAIVRYNSGTVSIAPVDGDVTLQSKNAERKISGRYGSVALKKVATDEWVLVGSLEA
jgi:hypothetical protein